MLKTENNIKGRNNIYPSSIYFPFRSSGLINSIKLSIRYKNISHQSGNNTEKAIEGTISAGTVANLE